VPKKQNTTIKYPMLDIMCATLYITVLAAMRENK